MRAATDGTRSTLTTIAALGMLLLVSAGTTGICESQVRQPRSPAGSRLLERARAATPERVRYAEAVGARVRLTPDGRSFSVLWTPPGSDPAAPPPMIVTIHGHASWAFDELFLWHPQARERGFGILALQWWFGEGEKLTDYYAPHEVYRNVDLILRQEGSGAGRALFHGFSRGSANTYGVVALDVDTKNRYFGLVVANAGKPGGDFPSNVEIERGRFGPEPFAGTHWVTACGGKDPHPDRDGCPGMDEAARWVSRYGGTIDLQIRDVAGDHGAFHRNPANVKAALDAFAARLEARGE